MCLVVEYPPEIIPVGKDPGLFGQKNPAGIHKVNDRQVVFGVSDPMELLEEEEARLVTDKW